MICVNFSLILVIYQLLLNLCDFNQQLIQFLHVDIYQVIFEQKMN